MKWNRIFAVLVISFPMSFVAQDYHFGQFDALAPTYQPGLTGMFDEYSYRGATQYRNQWRALANKPFSTFALSYDMPLKERWGVGGYIINYDGAKVFNAFNVVLSGAYRIIEPTQKEHVLNVGLQMGLIYKNTNNADLLFESQYDEGQFNPTLPSNESFTRFSKTLPEFNMGVYYEWTDPANMYHPYFGATAFHLTSPKESLLMSSEASRLPRRYLFNGGCKLDFDEQWSADVKLMHQFQGKAREWVMGATGSYLITDSETDVNLGCYYRVQDAVTVLAGVGYQDLNFMMSYDITTSGLKAYNGGKGAIEFTLVYTPDK